MADNSIQSATDGNSTRGLTASNSQPVMVDFWAVVVPVHATCSRRRWPRFAHDYAGKLKVMTAKR